MLKNAITAWIADVIHYLNVGNIARAQIRGQMLQADLEKLHGRGSTTAELDYECIKELKSHVACGVDKLRRGAEGPSALLNFKRAQDLWLDSIYSDHK